MDLPVEGGYQLAFTSHCDDRLYFHFRLLQLIEKASFDRIGVVLQTFAALLLSKYY
jgi:hypothetical protein